MCQVYFGSWRDVAKIIGDENCADMNLRQYFKLWAAPLWECTCVAFFVNFLLSGFFSKKQAMSLFHGLQMLLYFANFKILTKNKYFSVSH